MILKLFRKVRECAIGRSYDDCDGDSREERACNEDQVDVRGLKSMMTFILANKEQGMKN